MREIFRLFVTYSQIAVFNSDLEVQTNDWKDVHVAQGFAWRPGSVSFGTLVDSYPLYVEVQQATGVELRPETVRAIVVPFFVSPAGHVGLSDMGNDVSTAIPPGPYALVFETGYVSNDIEDGTWVRLSFIPQSNVEPAILRVDEGLNPPDILDMHAAPII